MRYIQVNNETIQKLEIVVKKETRYKSRHRAQAILLSNQGKKIDEIANMFGYSRRTICRWFDRFETEALAGLKELTGRGRKPLLVPEKHGQSILRQIKKT